MSAGWLGRWRAPRPAEAAPAAADDPLQPSAALLAALGPLRLCPPTFARGQSSGDRRGRGAGSGLEFAEHRPYQPGDDLRHLDAHAFLRLQQELVRTFHADRDQTVLIAADLSASTAIGRPRKADVIASIALGLAGVALNSRDSLRLRLLCADDPGPLAGRDRAAMPALRAAVESARPGGVAQVGLGLRGAAARCDRAVLISDALMEDEALIESLEGLRAAGARALLIQVVAPEDIEPASEGLLEDGDWDVIDVESNQQLRLSSDRRLRSAWAEAAQAWMDRVGRASLSLGVQRLVWSTRQALPPLFYGELRRIGWLQ